MDPSFLQRVRTILRKAVPGADEVISYPIPALRLAATKKPAATKPAAPSLRP